MLRGRARRPGKTGQLHPAVVLGCLVPALLTAAPRASADPAGFADVLVVGGLQAPTAFGFLPEGDLLVAERAGTVRVVRNGTLVGLPVVSLAVSTEFERGLVGLAVDPHFADTGWFYLYYTTAGATPVNRLVRYTMTGDTTTGSPLVLLDNIPSISGFHNGGGLAFGPDDMLYVAVGDSLRDNHAVDLGTLSGKILRITRDGLVPADNPFVGRAGARPQIWHYGLRNPYRFSIDTTGRMFIGDVGKDAYEEIDVAEPGSRGLNFGWPCREGAHPGPSPDPRCETGVTDPAYDYPHREQRYLSAAIIGGSSSGPDVYPAPFAGAWFFADYVRAKLHYTRYDSASRTAQVSRFGEGRPGVVQLSPSPDGRIYYASIATGEVRKLVHAAFPEVRPLELTAVAAATPANTEPGGQVLLTVTVGVARPVGLTVVADLSGLGQSAAQPLVDDGTSGDLTEADLVFSWGVTVAPSIPLGPVRVPVSVVADDGSQVTAAVDIDVRAAADADADGLADRCELAFGLNAASAQLPLAAAGDFDNDGATNLAECEAGTHPRGFFTRYFAEGATGPFFTTTFSLTNPRTVGAGQVADLTAHVHFRFRRADGAVVTHTATVPPQTQRTLDVADVPGMATAEFATVVESDFEVAVERSMSWDREGYGSHAETGVIAPSATWYFAEGATHSGFSLFYLLQNPGAIAATVEATYFLPAGGPLVKTYVLAPGERRTIWANVQETALASTDVAARFAASVPIVAERAMYLTDAAGRFWGVGHGGVGARETSTSWTFAEGATGDYFDLYLLLANPEPVASQVTVTYLRPSGAPIVRTYTVPPHSRRTLFVDAQDPLLRSTSLAIELRVTAGPGIVAERAMWWPGPTSASWLEAHVSLGHSASSSRWVVSGGEDGGAADSETYVLIANLSPAEGQARVTTLLDDGRAVERLIALGPQSRRTLDMRSECPEVRGHRFGVRIESIGDEPAELVVEHATYRSAGGIRWSAGESAAAEPAAAAEPTIVLTPLGASPAIVEIPAGGRIRVENADGADHWLASDAHGFPYSGFHLACTAMEPIGRLRPGEAALSGRFTVAGTCTLHDHLNFGAVQATVVVR
jgi:glucose/arabinose dehydrogenase